MMKLCHVIYHIVYIVIHNFIIMYSKYTEFGESKFSALHNFLSDAIPALRWYPLQWHHNERDGISNHQPHDCLHNRLFKAQIKENIKLRITGLRQGNSLVTSEFPWQRASNVENVSIWWRHHDCFLSIFHLSVWCMDHMKYMSRHIVNVVLCNNFQN